MDWETIDDFAQCPARGLVVFRTPFDLSLSECLLLRQGLQSEERARLERFKAESAALQYLQTRALLRIVLCLRLGCSNLELKLECLQSRRPVLDPGHGANLSFNATHTAQWGGVALADTGDVGLDFETHNPDRDLAAIARRHFSAAEQAAIDALNVQEDRLQAFFDIWTAKEACVKATGEGITADLQGFSVQLGPPGVPRTTDLPGSWEIHALSMPPGTSAALALRHPQPTPPALPRRIHVPAAAVIRHVLGASSYL